MFLNCNFPGECKIPRGKPKGLKFSLEMKKNGVRLFAENNGNVWLMKDHYYFGIELPKFIVKNIWGVRVFDTIANINLALLDWGDGRDNLTQLGHGETDLLQMYLLTLR